MENSTPSNTTKNFSGAGEVEKGINILTNSQPIIVDGADEAIEKWNKGEIDLKELYDIILNAEVVYIDRSGVSEFKESEDINI